LDERNAGLFGAAVAGGLIAVEPGSGRTSNPKVYAAGEAVTGGSTVVASMSAGMAAGRAIHAFLEGERNRS
jgi:NADPH-dependent glutamate synthase beta subunit-like oxidoreductase